MKFDNDLYFKKAIDLIAILCLIISYDLYMSYDSNFLWIIFTFISGILYAAIPSILFKGEKEQ